MITGKKSAEGINFVELRRLKRKRKKKRKRILLSIMLMLMICIGILFTPVFNLKEININGNAKITTEEIVKKSGFIVGENIFKFKLNDAGENISKIPYVNSVLIERKLPGKVEITITECIPMAYIAYDQTFVVVDKDGKVLETKTEEVNYLIPVLSDFSLKQFAVGKKITEKDNEKLQKTLEITKNLYNNNLIEKIKNISYKNNGFNLSINENLNVIIGDTENISAKLIMLKEVLNKIPSDATGVIDARDANKVYHRSE